MDIENSSVINIENATVEFKKGTIGTITTYQFDTSNIVPLRVYFQRSKMNLIIPIKSYQMD